MTHKTGQSKQNIVAKSCAFLVVTSKRPEKTVVKRLQCIKVTQKWFKTFFNVWANVTNIFPKMFYSCEFIIPFRNIYRVKKEEI